MQEAILGIDAGTSAMKGVVYDLTGAELFATQQVYRLSTPQSGWAELDIEQVWHALVAVMHAAGAATAGQVRIAALALAAQAGSVVPVDQTGAPLAPMITWLDRRAESLVTAWQADGAAARIRAISGWHLHPGLPIATIGWLVRNVPQVASRTHRYLGAHEFLLERLTGRCVTDLSEGAEMLLLDQATGAWSAELCELAGIHTDQLAELAPAGTVVGPLLASVSQMTGLATDTQVVAGGHDQCCAALGMGVTAPGELMLATGTAWVLTALTPEMSVAQAPAEMELNFHVTPGLHTLSQYLGGLGATVEWWLNIAAPIATTPAARFAQFDSWLKSTAAGAGSLTFLPLDGSAQLAYATPGAFVGLRLDHAPADIARAICQGAAYEVRWALDNLAGAGLTVQRIWLSGGATHSSHWPAILADVTGLPLHMARGASWPARGAAMLAGAGCGLLGSMAEMATRWRLSLDTVEPDRSNTALYAVGYAAHQQRAAQLVARSA